MSETVTFRLPMVEGHAHITKTPGKPGYEYGVAETARFLQNACCGQDLQRVHFIVYRICGMCPASHEEALFKSLEKIENIELSDSSKSLREIKRILQAVKDSVFHYCHFAIPVFSKDTISFFEGKKRQDLHQLGTIYKRLNAFAKQGVDDIKLHLGGAALKKPEFLNEIDDMIALAKTVVEEFAPPDHENTEHMELALPMATVNGTQVVVGTGDGKIQEYDFDDFMLKVGYTVENYALFEGKPLKTGPQARMYLMSNIKNYFSPFVAERMEQFKKGTETRHSLNLLNPFDEHYLRILEIIDHLEKVKTLIGKVENEKKIKISPDNITGFGYGYVEAPRGMLIYRTNIEKGIIHSLNIVTPTAFFIPYINDIIKNANTEKEAVEVIVAGNPCNACFEER